MDWQSMLIFSLTLAVSFHVVGHTVGYVAYRFKDRTMDRLLREIRNVDVRLDEYKVKRVK